VGYRLQRIDFIDEKATDAMVGSSLGSDRVIPNAETLVAQKVGLYPWSRYGPRSPSSRIVPPWSRSNPGRSTDFARRPGPMR